MSTQARTIEGFRQELLSDEEDLPILDPAPLRSLRALEAVGGPGLADEVVGAFLESVPQSLAALREAAARGDSASLERVAHSLRGSCGIVGARRMAERAATIERGAWGADEESEEDLQRLGLEWRAVEGALRDLDGRRVQ